MLWISARLGRRVLIGAALAALGVIVAARAGVPAPLRWLEPSTELLASLVQVALAWGGIDTLRHGAFVYAPGAFAYDVGIGCTGLLPAGAVATAILASPGTTASRAWGLAVGVPVVLFVNLLRLAHLFYLGMREPWGYDDAHGLWWPAALMAVAFAVWLAPLRLFRGSLRSLR